MEHNKSTWNFDSFDPHAVELMIHKDLGDTFTIDLLTFFAGIPWEPNSIRRETDHVSIRFPKGYGFILKYLVIPSLWGGSTITKLMSKVDVEAPVFNRYSEAVVLRMTTRKK